jgi:hypothetical protein
MPDSNSDKAPLECANQRDFHIDDKTDSKQVLAHREASGQGALNNDQ